MRYSRVGVTQDKSTAYNALSLKPCNKPAPNGCGGLYQKVIQVFLGGLIAPLR